MTRSNLRERILVGPALRAQPDRRLVALAREGHGPAIEEAVKRYRTELVQYAATIVPADRADDVVQDSITKALPSIRGGDTELQLRPWLYAIVRNTALNNLRDAGPRLEYLDENFDGAEQPPEAFERQEDLRSVVTRMNELPVLQRDALVKREMEGMSHSEIGGALGITVAAARQLIHRGRSTLRTGMGALIPMPVLRQLLEGMDSSGVAVGGATAAGGMVATKAAVVLIAAGGIMTAGVALNRYSHEPADAQNASSAVGGDSPAPALVPPGSNSNSSADASGRVRLARDEGPSGAGAGNESNASSSLAVGGTQGKSTSDNGGTNQGSNPNGGGGSGHHASGDDGQHSDPGGSGHGGTEGSELDESGESGGSHSGSGTVAEPPPRPPDVEDDSSGSGSGSSGSGSSGSQETESALESDLGDSLGFQ